MSFLVLLVFGFVSTSVANPAHANVRGTTKAIAAKGKVATLARVSVDVGRGRQIKASLRGTAQGPRDGFPKNVQSYGKPHLVLDKGVGIFGRKKFPVTTTGLYAAIGKTKFTLDANGQYREWSLLPIASALGKMGIVKAMSHSQRDGFKLINPSAGGAWHYRIKDFHLVDRE